MKKQLALFTSVILVLALVACGGQSGNTGGSATTQAATTAAAGGAAESTTAAEGNAAGGAAESTTAAAGNATTAAAAGGAQEQDEPVKELYEISVVDPSYKGGSELRLLDEYIRDRFGIVIKHISFQGDSQEQQMLLLASKDYGEVQRMEYDRVYKAYYDAGVLLSLDPYLDKLPDFQRIYKDAIPYFRLAANGDLIRWDVDIPMRGDTDIEVNDLLVRSDVLEHYGWPTPVTEDDWVELLKKALVDFPTTPEGVKTVGMAVPFANSWGLSSLATINYEKGDAFTELNNADGGVLFDMKKDMFVDYFLEPNVKECFAFFNRLYREGILDVESLTDTSDPYQQKLNNGSALTGYYVVWTRDEANRALMGLGHEEMSYVNMPLQSNTQFAEKQKRAIRVEDTRIHNAWGITDNCRYPERIIELINWACTDEGQIILVNGLEGQHWIRNADGKREFTEDGIRVHTDPDYNLNEIGLRPIPFLPHFNLLLSDGQFPSLLSHSEINDQFLMPRVKESYEKLGWSSSKSWWVDNGFFASTGLPGAISIDPSDSLNDVATKMFELRVKTTASLIMADSAQEFEEIYEAAVGEHNKLNPQAVVDKYNEIYQTEKVNLK